MTLFDPIFFDIVTGTMAVLAVIVFIVLQRVDAGYGMTFTTKWGVSMSNKVGWVLMELPAFVVMALIWATSPRAAQPAACVMAGLFELHYFQRTFIFPMLMRGRSRIPLMIVAMGMVFNAVNAYLIGGWLFHVAPDSLYPVSWLWSPLFILGTVVFFAGMAVNLHSDHIIRNLRKPGDTAHYIPKGGMYRWVTAANYLGELIEWTGFAILTWSLPAAVFVLWTFANLAPRAKNLNKKYAEQFGPQFTSLKRRYLIPFIY